jgi:hypothetical protein
MICIFFRLSKKDALIISEEVEEESLGTNDSSAITSSPTSPTKTVNDSTASTSTPNKSFERKNSFLGKLFSGRKKSSSPGSGGAKPEIATFSAQFPPDTVLPPDASYSSAIYAPVRKRTKSPEPAPRATVSESVSSPMAQVRNGPNGNFVIYERVDMPPVSTSPPRQLQQPIYGHQQQQNNQQQQQHQQQQQQQQQVYGVNNPLRYQYPRMEGMYSNPPPPMPYRPPPPNPYRTSPPPIRSPVSAPAYQTPPPPSTSSTNYTPRSSPFVAKRNDVAANVGVDSSDLSSSSGPSSLDSQQSQRKQQQQQLATPESPRNKSSPLYGDSLIVIERSNRDLEQKLKSNNNSKDAAVSSPPVIVVNTLPNRMMGGSNGHHHHNRFNRAVDTIHNRLSQEVIYEVPDSGESPAAKESVQTTSFPSISDLTLADIGGSNNFKSLTAQKLMAGLSFNSIDTLIEVNAAADARNNFNESTETIDFGVI